METADKIFSEVKHFIGRVPEDKLLAVWPRALPLAKKMIAKHPGMTVEALLGDLLVGLTELWVIGDFKAISILRKVQKPRESMLFIEWLGGEAIDEWVEDWLRVAEAYAKALGCDAIEFHGRIGYRRYEKRFNYKPINTVYRKELT